MISKKDLLKETGISYGQLYRWKRSGLIPESWFIKQSSYTGQETFFPRDQVLDRVRSIQELKDDYSLEELARILSSEILANSIIEEEVLLHNQIFSIEMLEGYKTALSKTNLKYIDVIMLSAFQAFVEEGVLQKKQVMPLLEINKENILEVQDVHRAFVIAEYEQIIFLFITQDVDNLCIDARFKKKQVKNLETINSEFKKRFRLIL